PVAKGDARVAGRREPGAPASHPMSRPEPGGAVLRITPRDEARVGREVVGDPLPDAATQVLDPARRRAPRVRTQDRAVPGASPQIRPPHLEGGPPRVTPFVASVARRALPLRLRRQPRALAPRVSVCLVPAH